MGEKYNYLYNFDVGKIFLSNDIYIRVFRIGNKENNGDFCYVKIKIFCG